MSNTLWAIKGEIGWYVGFVSGVPFLTAKRDEAIEVARSLGINFKPTRVKVVDAKGAR